MINEFKAPEYDVDSSFETIYEEKEKHAKTLYRSICLPSLINGYSLGIEYMKHWFISKFPEKTFKEENIHIDGSHVLDDFRRLKKTDMLKKMRPFLTITPSIELDYNNDSIDSLPFGLSLYAPVGRWKDSFFRDSEHNMCMGLGVEGLKMQFSFKVKVSTKAEMMDFYKFMKIAYKVGYTFGEEVDLDFHMPYDLMIQIASDAGFNIIETSKGKQVENTQEFVRYLNSHSQLPIMNKFRCMNGKNEYFIKFTDMFIRISDISISSDDGSKNGMLYGGYGVGIECSVIFPAPKLFAYYSENEHNLERLYSIESSGMGNIHVANYYTIKVTDIPDENIRGWQLFLSTVYEDPDSLGIPLKIDLKELFQGDILKVINDCYGKGISPDIFIDVLLLNNNKKLHYKIDWDNMILTTEESVELFNTYIGVYVDMAFLNERIIDLRSEISARLSEEKKS